MTTSPLRCGILGTGTFARSHAEAIQKNPALKMVAACDKIPAKSKEFVSVWGGTDEKDYASLLQNHELDILVLATPDATHGSIACDILKQPRAPRLLVIEKPLCVSKEELHTLASLLQTKKMRVVVNHSRRFNAGFLRLQELIGSHTIGAELLSIHFRYYAGWLKNGVHAVDLLRMLFGEMTCQSATFICADRSPEDPLLDVVLSSKKFPHASIRLEGVPEHPYQLFEGEHFFSKGRIRIQFDDIFIDHLGEGYAGAPSLEFYEHFKADSSLDALKTLYASCVSFLSHGESGVLERAGFEEALGTMNILFSAQSKAKK